MGLLRAMKDLAGVTKQAKQLQEQQQEQAGYKPGMGGSVAQMGDLLGTTSKQLKDLLDQPGDQQGPLTGGIQGTAQILGMTQTGLQVNEQPQVELHLRIEAHGIAPYELRKKFIVPLIALGTLSVGRLSVEIDREDHENVRINWGQSSAPMTLSTQDGRTFDLGADADLREQVFAILRKHGLAMSGELDLRKHPAAREEVIALLESQDHDLDLATPQSSTPAAAAGRAEPESGNPVQRLEDLRELKEKGLVSEAEYESKRMQIISEF